jgi:hypothetical protein
LENNNNKVKWGENIKYFIDYNTIHKVIYILFLSFI